MSTTNKYRLLLWVYLVLSALVLILLSPSGHGAPVVRQASGANPAAIQAMVELFRADLGGVNNGVGGTFASGRRELSWDDVPDNVATPNNFPSDFFNVTSPRGIILNALEFEAGSALNQLMVSATAASGTAVRFGNLNPNYPAAFQTFSPQRLFAAYNATAFEVVFFVPGTKIPATVKGFGLIFADVDLSTGGTRSVVRCYAPDGSKLAASSALVASNGLSFVGISFNAGERIARVVVECGNTPLSASSNDSATVDVVAMDDFIYGEPQPLETQVAPAIGEPFAVTTIVPLKFSEITFSGAPAGFVNATLRCAPHHSYRILASTDLISWHPATILGLPAGSDQNLFDPRNPSLWSALTYTAPLTLSREGQNKLFYIARDEVTGDVTYGETP